MFFVLRIWALSCCCFHFCVLMSGAKKRFEVCGLMKGRKTAKGQHEAEMKAIGKTIANKKQQLKPKRIILHRPNCQVRFQWYFEELFIMKLFMPYSKWMLFVLTVLLTHLQKYIIYTGCLILVGRATIISKQTFFIDI